MNTDALIRSLGLMSVLGVTFAGAGLAQDGEKAMKSPPAKSSARPAEVSAGTEEKSAGKTQQAIARKSVSGRLPRYYSAVVTGDQKVEIYKIQAEFRSQIVALEAQLADLKLKESSRIEAVLSVTQRKRLEQVREKRRKPSSETSSKS